MSDPKQNESAERVLNNFVMANLDALVDEAIALQMKQTTLDACPLSLCTLQLVVATGVPMPRAQMTASHIVAAAGMIKYQLLRDWLRSGGGRN